jgi:hypothetical protein
MDAALDYIANNAATLLVCTAQPTDRADALSKALADVVIDSSDFTKADHTPSGRKTTLGAHASFAVDTSGTATHIAIISASALLRVNTCTSQALTAGNTVSTPAYIVAAITDPTAI